MPKCASKITRAEIARVIKAAIDGGFKPVRFEVEGSRVVVYGTDAALSQNVSPLDGWRRTNGEG